MGGAASTPFITREVGRGMESLGIPGGGEVTRQSERALREHERAGKTVKGVFVPEPPEFPPFPPFPEVDEAESDLIDEEEARKLAQQRRSLELRRRGRRALRIERPAGFGGLASAASSGLRIPGL